MNPIKIKRFLKSGDLSSPLPIDTDELLHEARGFLDTAHSWDILGTILFEGEDGRFYVASVECVIGEAHPAYLKEALEEEKKEQELLDIPTSGDSVSDR